MKRLFLLTMIVLALGACQQKTEITVKDQEASCCGDSTCRDGLFIHLSHGYDDHDRAAMGLSLAVKMSDSVDVIVFCDMEGVKLLTKTAEHINSDHYMCPLDARDELIKKKVTIMACPMCMKRASIKEEDLVEGVIIADATKFFGFTKGRILTLDY